MLELCGIFMKINELRFSYKCSVFAKLRNIENIAKRIKLS